VVVLTKIFPIVKIAVVASLDLFEPTRAVKNKCGRSPIFVFDVWQSGGRSRTGTLNNDRHKGKRYEINTIQLADIMNF
jgi:hypothetical protein